MKIASIGSSNQSFKGLWSQIKIPSGADMYTTFWHYDNKYYPFSDEGQASIQSAVSERTYKVSCPGVNEYEIEEIHSDVSVMKKLPFTEALFKKYKTFYGEVLTEELKNVEEALKSLHLYDYLNGGFWYNCKKLLHKFKHKIKII